MVYDAARFKDNPPKTWADFWDLKKFPGKRMLRKDLRCMIDAGVMSAGAPLDKVSPIDEKLAWAQLKKIKDQCVYRKRRRLRADHAHGRSLDGHSPAHPRQSDVRRIEGQARVHLESGDSAARHLRFAKNNPAGKDAMRLLRSMQEPEPQVGLLRFFGNGPTNPKAIAWRRTSSSVLIR